MGVFKTNTFSLSSLSTGQSSLVQNTKSQDTSAATPPGSNLPYPPVTFLKNRIQSIQEEKQSNKKEPEDIYIASHAVMHNRHLE